MAASRLEFRLLGPLTVRVDGVPIAVGGPKQRALLALLLLSANRVVSRDRLIDELFAEQSVNSADHALRNHVSRLRKVLARRRRTSRAWSRGRPATCSGSSPASSTSSASSCWSRRGARRSRPGDAAAAADSLRAAEALWQGRPLADLELEPFARVEVERLEELRLAARRGADRRRARARPSARARGRARGARRRTPVPRALPRAADARALPLRPAGRRARGLPADAEAAERRARARARASSCSSSSGRSSRRTRRSTSPPTAAGRAGDAATTSARSRAWRRSRPADAEFFFGRERLVDELVARLADAPLLAIVGASGSGKSSLLRAGLLPGARTRLAR